MRYELKSLHSKLNKTFIYITDSIENAFSLSNKMAIMQHGVIHQCATLNLYMKTQEHIL